jgi:hypothetical protein
LAGTTITAVKAALVSQLSTLPALSGVQITYADPGDTARKESIWCGTVRDADHEPVALKAGRRRREENYELLVHVEVMGTRLTPQRTEERATALALVVEEHLADNPNLSGEVPGLLFAVVGGLEMTTDQTTAGPRTFMSIRINVKSRLL